MATLGAMRDALKDVIEDNVSTLRVYDAMPDQTDGHCLLVMPDTGDFAKSFGRGHDEWVFNLYVIIPWQETTVVQDKLDQYVSGSGTKSIREVIYNNRTLGGVVDDAFVRGMRGFGGQFQLAKIPHVGAILDLVVLTSGTS
jgi:hypothetical protein